MEKIKYAENYFKLFSKVNYDNEIKLSMYWPNQTQPKVKFFAKPNLT